MFFRPRRSVLYAPGSNERAITKTATLAADAFILDLEDSVAPEAKESARRIVADSLRRKIQGRRETIVRINGLGTPWFAEDVELAAKNPPDAVLVPKVARAEDIFCVKSALRHAQAPEPTKLWAMIETPQAILNAEPIAKALREANGEGSAFVLGMNDLAKETRARRTTGREPMLAWMSWAVLSARAHEIDVIDGVFTEIHDLDGFRRECEQGRDLGMDGKSLIHPAQIAAANAVFAPSAEELAEARRIAAAFDRPENAIKGAIALDGRMVERLHVEMARRTIGLAEAIAHLQA